MTPTIRVALINNTNSYRFQFIMGLLIAGARATGTSGKLYFSALPPIFRRIPPFQNINIHPSFILHSSFPTSLCLTLPYPNTLSRYVVSLNVSMLEVPCHAVARLLETQFRK